MKYYINESAIIYENYLFDSNEIKKNVESIKNKILSVVQDSNVPIAIMTGRSPELVFSMIALLEIGIPFLNINVDLPDEKIQFMLETAEVKNAIVLNQEDIIFNEINKIVLSEIKDNEELYNKKYNIKKSDIAYMIFTSGTTGNPKAVEIKKSGLDNFIKGVTEIIEFNESKRIISIANFTFDIFFLETILALSRGTKVYLASETQRKNPRLIKTLIEENHINMIQATPSVLSLLQMYDSELSFLKDMDSIMVGGEAMPKSLHKLLKKNTFANIYNMYGPTETTVWSMIADLTNEETIHLGKPILNTQIFLLDTDLKKVKEGKCGEICISGKGLAKGYYNNKDLTEKKFVEYNGCRLYCTGDLGMYDEEGRLIFLGRNDSQVKVRGHRIELEEINEKVKSYLDILNAVTCVFKSKNREEIIVFYQSDCKLNEQDIMMFLKKKLVDYMMPQKLIKLDEFFYTESGKIDINRFKKEYEDIKKKNKVKKIDTEISDTEKVKNTILKIVSNSIENDEYSIYSPLNIIGCDSLSFLDIIVQIEEKYHIKFDDKIILSGVSITLKELLEESLKLIKIK